MTTPDELTPAQRKIFEFLRDNLRVNIKSGGFTDPNKQTVELLLCGERISSDSFSVRQSREYEG